jgi:hypothetical protein
VALSVLLLVLVLVLEIEWAVFFGWCGDGDHAVVVAVACVIPAATPADDIVVTVFAAFLVVV